MIRIRTRIGDDWVFTLFFNGEWVTIVHENNCSTSIGSPSLLEAGQNHLAFSQRLRDSK